MISLLTLLGFWLPIILNSIQNLLLKTHRRSHSNLADIDYSDVFSNTGCTRWSVWFRKKDLPWKSTKTGSQNTIWMNLLHQQYFRYLEISSSDFGPSFQYKDFTNGIDCSRISDFTYDWVWLYLCFFVGISIGTVAAVKQNSWVDYLLMSKVRWRVFLSLILWLHRYWYYCLPSILMCFLPVVGAMESLNIWFCLFCIVFTIHRLYCPFDAWLNDWSACQRLHSHGKSEGTFNDSNHFKTCSETIFDADYFPISGGSCRNHNGSVVIEKILESGTKIFRFRSFEPWLHISHGRSYFISVMVVLFNLIVDILYAWLDPKLRVQSQWCLVKEKSIIRACKNSAKWNSRQRV